MSTLLGKNIICFKWEKSYLAGCWRLLAGIKIWSKNPIVTLTPFFVQDFIFPTITSSNEGLNHKIAFGLFLEELIYS